MKTSSFLSWKYLISKIHPPLPLDRRESQELLSLLQSSFRQQLDREHPINPSGNRYTANNHLRSVLANPLFSVNPKWCGDSILHQHFGSHGNPKRFQDIWKLPTEYFSKQVSLGTATLDTVKACLAIQHQKQLLTLTESKKSDGIGSIVLEWLWSTGITNSNSFLLDKALMDLLIPFLIFEGHEDQIWRWVKQLQPKREDVSSSAEFTQIRQIIFKLVVSKVQHGEGLSSAINSFVSKFHERTSIFSASGNHAHRLFSPAGGYLTTMVSQAPQVMTLKPENFEGFRRTVDSWSSRNLYHHGLLELNHPENPHASSALLYIRKLFPAQVAMSKPKKRILDVRLGLKTAELLLTQGLQSDALWVMSFLESHYGQEIGLSVPAGEHVTNHLQQDKHLAHDEESSLRSLKALDGEYNTSPRQQEQSLTHDEETGFRSIEALEGH